jgi:putative ABC transport system permease protein
LGSPPAATANHPPRSRSLTPPTPSPAERAVDETLAETLANLRLSRADVAQLVGGIGIANVMVIGALERRTLIGVRRALGAIAGLSPAARAARLAPADSLRPT